MKNCEPTGIRHDPYVKLFGENRFRRTELFLRKKLDVHRKILSIKTLLNEKWRGYGNYFYYNFEHHFPATSFGTFREIFEEILSRIHKDSFFCKIGMDKKRKRSYNRPTSWTCSLYLIVLSIHNFNMIHEFQAIRQQIQERNFRNKIRMCNA